MDALDWVLLGSAFTVVPWVIIWTAAWLCMKYDICDEGADGGDGW